MTRTAVTFPDYLTGPSNQGKVVQVEKVTASPFYDTTYAVFVDGVKVGYTASRRERGHTTLWASSTTLGSLGGAYSPSRASAIDNLLSALARKA